MGRNTKRKSGRVVVGMAPELRLDPYTMPAALRKVFENDVKPFLDMTPKQEAFLSAIDYVIRNKEIEPSSYVIHLKLLLYMEEYAREIDMRMYDLKDQKIQYSGNSKEFMVYVPGLSEERPSLQLYDEIQLRQSDGNDDSTPSKSGKSNVCTPSKGKGSNVCTSTITYIGQKFVKVLSTAKFAKKYNEDHRYNVKFLLPRRTIQCCHLAVDLINMNQLVPALFPEVRTCYNKLSKNLCWFDQNIANNAEQKQAIANIVARTAHPAPYILFGPPGTGKTATLVEAVSQIWRTSPSSHVLICTPSNAAADEVLKRLLKNIPEQDIHRMYGPSRNWDDIDEKIQPCSNFVDGEIIFLPRELIMLRRVVVVTLMSCARLLALNLRPNHFAYVFIDEAGQATEPETLIPLGLMSSADSSHKGRLQGQLVIAGDPMQLGPSIAMKNVDTLAKSMLERLMEQCAPYKKDKAGKYNPTYITKLIRNFRSNNFILHVPNKLFYDGELLACGKNEDINRAANHAILPNKSFPLIFHVVLADERRESSSPSVFNVGEIAVIMSYLQDLIGAKLGGRKLEQKDIGIVTPYKLQRMKIHQELERRNWDGVSVGTVEVFQGQERDVIIMSTVRSVIYKHNGKQHIGFLSNPKRFNVAVTRAKSLLIIVGNPNILQYDDCWQALMNYCSANNAFIGTNLSHMMSKRQRRPAFGKKFVPKQASAEDFEFPVDAQDMSLNNFENCIIPERLVPKKKARLPKINKDLSPVAQFDFDSGITSASNSSSTTDLEQQDRVSDASSTDGRSSPEENEKEMRTGGDEEEEEEEEEEMEENSREENDSPSTTAVQMDARDVNKSEMETMKGDTIGDTMYSAKWIINALISLSNVYEKGWSESLESELCLLWDMTTEKDVTLFLDENNFLKIAEVSLKVSDSPRMTEILVGILGNMCCQPSVIKSLAEREELVALLFNLLVVDDTETLIQLLRLLRVGVWDIQLHTAENSSSLWLGHLKNCPIFGTSLIFILNSSTNDDLLIAAVDLVQLISTTKLPDEKLLESLFDVKELLKALLESFTQIIPKQDGNHTRSELKVIESWLTILTAITESSRSMFVENENNENLNNILDTLLRILQPYVHSHNLIPLEERSAVCIHQCVKLILSFQQSRLPVGPEIVFIVVTIMYHLKSASKSSDLESDSDNNERELSTYLEKYWFQILDIYEGNQLQDILQMCEENIVKYVMDMTKSHLETTSDKMEKLTIANDFVNQ